MNVDVESWLEGAQWLSEKISCLCQKMSHDSPSCRP